MEILKKVFGLLDNCIRIDWAIFFLLWQGYLSSAVTVLKNSPKISDLTMRDVFELNLSLNNETIAKTFSGADFCSIWDPFTRWLPKGVLKRNFLYI